MGRDLVVGELPVTLGGASRNVLGSFPLINAGSHEIGHRDLRALDVAALAERRNQFGLLNLSLALGALEAVPAALALAGCRIAHVDDDRPVAGRSLTKMSPHFESSP